METDKNNATISMIQDHSENNLQQPAEFEMDEEAAAKEHLTSHDATKIVFLSSNSEYTRKNGGEQVDIGEVPHNVGMGKEELMKFANQPFWVRLRMTLFVLFWVVWLAMLIGSVVIIVVIPGCPPAPQLQWSQKTVVYQILISDFKDSDGDTVGDLLGIISKLSYIEDLKITTLLLSPVFKTMGVDFTKEVTNFTNVARHFGTLDDFKNLIAQAHKKGIKIILELDPNHSSDKHEWFVRSENSEEPFSDFYIWAKGKPGTGEPGLPPNDLVNADGGSAWTWSPKRKMFYLHQFQSGQPDLDLRNSELRQEFKNILRFWLDIGVDGFKINVIDNPFENQKMSGGSQLLQAYFTKSRLSNNLEVLREFRDLLVNYTISTDNRHRILLSDSPGNNIEPFYGQLNNSLVDYPFNLQLTSFTNDSSSADLYDAFQQSFNSTPHGFWPNWVLGSAHQRRLISRVGPRVLDGLHMATLLSKGTPVVYFGDELGLPEDTILMPWNQNSSLEDTTGINVQSELLKSHSHLSIFRKLMSLREKRTIGFGSQDFPIVDGQIFSMLRAMKGAPGYLVVINFFGNSTVVDFSGTSEFMPEVGNVELATDAPGYLKDTGVPKVKLAHVVLGPYQAAILSFVPKDKKK